MAKSLRCVTLWTNISVDECLRNFGCHRGSRWSHMTIKPHFRGCSVLSVPASTSEAHHIKANFSVCLADQRHAHHFFARVSALPSLSMSVTMFEHRPSTMGQFSRRVRANSWYMHCTTSWKNSAAIVGALLRLLQVVLLR